MKSRSKIFSIGIKEQDPVHIVRQKEINNQVTLFTVTAAAFFIPYLLLIKNYYYLPFEIAATLLISLSFLFNYYGLLKLSMFWRFAVFALDVTYGSLEMPFIGAEYFLLLLAVIPFILSNNTTTQITLFSISLFFFFFRKLALHYYIPHSHLTNAQNLVTYFISLTMVFVLCCLFVIRFKIAGAKYEKIIKMHSLEIEEQKKDILDSITYAHRLQMALLPPKEELQKALKDYFLFYKPKDIVSGDFYWLEWYNGKLFVAVADCTGHGVPGAMMSVLCTNTLTKVVRELGIDTPSLILDKVASLMEDQLSKTRLNVMDGMDIGLCCIDYTKKAIEFAGAYNPIYCISDANLTEIKGDKQPVGKMENRKSYTNHTIHLSAGDCYYLLSDGFCDQFGGVKGKKYSSKQLKKWLTLNSSKPMQEQGYLLKENFDGWKGSVSQVDDICVLGFRIDKF